MGKAKIPEPEDVNKMFWMGLAALAIAMFVITAMHVRQAKTQQRPFVIARAGEWVTHPDGTKVCRLRYDLFAMQVMETSYCEDWQEPIPFRGQQVDFLMWSPWNGGHINIEGKWRP